MARANDLQTSPAKAAHSNGQKLAPYLQTLNDTGAIDVATEGADFLSDSGDDEDIPAVRPENYAAAAEDGRHQEEQDEDDADEIAGLINDASLSGTHNSTLDAAG